MNPHGAIDSASIPTLAEENCGSITWELKRQGTTDPLFSSDANKEFFEMLQINDTRVLPSVFYLSLPWIGVFRCG